ncbi:MAG: hypothetical protein IPK63_05470 [Candidatus Competibacteraceae bacterium]|nr:hypothetical protein [Candidatus Competibacteraceae bacterium]
MDKMQLQWLLAVIGAVVLALIYLWGIRARLKEEIRKRQRRSAFANEPKLELGPVTPTERPEEAEEVHEFGELGRVTADHHLADKILVDVEIRPLSRSPDRRPAVPRSPLEKSHLPSGRESLNAGLEQEESLSGRDSLDRGLVDLGDTGQTDMDNAFQAKPAVEAPSLPPILQAMPAGESATAKTTVALTVMAPGQQLFKGTDIQAAAEEAGLQLTTAGLFGRYPAGVVGGDTPVFSLAHLRKPGSFDPKTLADLTTPGLLLFMELPGPLDGMKALDLLVLAADQVARKLGGVICDESRRRLTNQGLLSLRDKVAELERSGP